jgi:DNA adenine methylase
MSAPTRPALRYHGGKWRLAPWIISHFPPHRVYVEPFGGAASVLLRKDRSYAEVYNDLDDEVVNLFRVLRDKEHARQLIELLELTPFARRELEEAYSIANDPIERARRLCVLAFQGFGSTGAMLAGDTRGRTTGFRANSLRSGKHPAGDWQSFPNALRAIVERLQGVVIENRPALQVIEAHDDAETLFYVDPPYVGATRSKKNKYDRSYHSYRHELTDADHKRLLAALRNVRGMVLVSGYACRLYDEALADWRRFECRTHADGARDRTEILWLSPRAYQRLSYKPAPLFDALHPAIAEVA